MRTLNLGIVAHVDAGKTTLTERLLYAAGVIDRVGSVDEGSTHTDSLPLERQRGITIKAAVVSFAIDDVAVNLIDTPGHPEFIAEVERVLNVLDGAVLVLSAVEGVQAQTRVLMRALRRLRIPTLLFVNKIDRMGAREEATLRAIAEKLTPAIVPMGTVHDAGTRSASFAPFDHGDDLFTATMRDRLAEHDDDLLRDYIDDAATLPYRRLRRQLAVQTRRALVHPVYLGSAATGAGVDRLAHGIAHLLPSAPMDPTGPASGTVFKVERGPAGEKIAYVRMFSGEVRIRDRVRPGEAGKVTAIAVFDHGGAVRRPSVAAGQIGQLWGLHDIRIGEDIGEPRAAASHRFAPPTLETVVMPDRPHDKGRLYAALAQLAEQDPLIDLRQDDVRRELYVSLYGEVQKEVIQATLENEYAITVSFRETTTICVERPTGSGEAVELLSVDPNPFLATVGLRVEPAPIGSGVAFRIEAELGAMPLAFFRAVEDTVRETLRQGLSGWEVTDCTVAMTHAGYVGKHGLGHQYFNKSMSSTGEDFRKLTPLVLMDALRQAGTIVCEPIHRFRIDVPADALGAFLPALGRLRAFPGGSAIIGSACTLEGTVPAANVHALHQVLPGLTRGEGVLETAFDHYEPVLGEAPARPRTDADPLDRKEYLRRVARRV